jgi:hypothetical protein
MAGDHRIRSSDGHSIPFTCENRRYATDLTEGLSHGPNSEARGSVLEAPLFDFGAASIWLEHVVERTTGEKCYWLMWYDADGRPTIPLSGVFGRQDLERAAQALRTLTYRSDGP